MRSRRSARRSTSACSSGSCSESIALLTARSDPARRSSASLTSPDLKSFRCRQYWRFTLLVNMVQVKYWSSFAAAESQGELCLWLSRWCRIRCRTLYLRDPAVSIDTFCKALNTFLFAVRGVLIHTAHYKGFTTMSSVYIYVLHTFTYLRLKQKG